MILSSVLSLCPVNQSTNCSLDLNGGHFDSKVLFGERGFVIGTPIILSTGIIGNGLSLAVFRSKALRKLTASSYLAALSIADMATLLTYVLVEWLRRGLRVIQPDINMDFLERNGMCQVQIYLSYISRIMSAWIIVMFTIERFLAICYPLKRLKRGVGRVILYMFIVAALAVLYKPIMTREKQQRTLNKTIVVCTSYSERLSAILDTVYAISITIIPLLIITALNILIVAKLFKRNRERGDLFSEDANSKIRLEFTVILVVISCCYVVFNIPYNVMWILFRNVEHYTKHQSAILFLARTFFYMNNSANFLLYSVTGRSFRCALKKFILCRSARNDRYGSHIRCRRLGSSMSTQHTAASKHTPSVRSVNHS
ncbi:neuropeptides capa receptor-like [Dreissena polymorpha]|uniref:G-protein coupled receptors family 1 profile domain-containing protein n=1 Tax=Dreissena polymorpha TaxID=45954 RepID=A0A9D4ENT4_DREPO|nr:neuropeptides capa receptor-like [Dreissena polymorpha]KAH3783046.1 hypothetical protein DPMN_160973 [Dreissena polymorpha]